MKIWQFKINGRNAGPERDKWITAVGDAIRLGFATWVRFPIVIQCEAGAEIERKFKLAPVQ